MPTAHTHPGAAYSLLAELAYTIAARLHLGPKPASHTLHVDFPTHRVGIASAICLRHHSVDELDEHDLEVDAWMRLTALTYRRRLLLIQAGIPVSEALSPKTAEWDDEALEALVSLSRMATE